MIFREVILVYRDDFSCDVERFIRDILYSFLKPAKEADLSTVSTGAILQLILKDPYTDPFKIPLFINYLKSLRYIIFYVSKRDFYVSKWEVYVSWWENYV